MTLTQITDNEGARRFHAAFRSAVVYWDKNLEMYCMPHWAPSQQSIIDYAHCPDTRVIAYQTSKELTSGAIYEMAPGGFNVLYMFSKNSSAYDRVPSLLISKIWTMKTRHWVTFMVPDGEWELITTLQRLGCQTELAAGHFGTTDGWKLKFDATNAKKMRKK